MLRIIGDIHDQIDEYLKLIEGHHQSLQLGDFAREFSFLENVSPKHKFFGGNHDHYPNMMAWMGGHHLGHFGLAEFEEFPLFYVRGGMSVDYHSRRMGYNWWPEEQLSYSQCCDAIEMYSSLKPDFIVTHEAPLSIVPYITDPKFMERFRFGNSMPRTNTNSMLETMRDEHKPAVHVFGHYHRAFDQVVDGTRFICIPPCQAVDFVREDGLFYTVEGLS